jgi:hypothetical protein
MTLAQTINLAAVKPSMVLTQRVESWKTGLSEAETQSQELVARGRAALYGFFDQKDGIYATGFRVLSAADDSKAWENAISALLKEKEITVHRDSSVFTKLLKLVLGADRENRQRISTYANAMTRAAHDFVQPGQLVDFLADRGGFEGLRKMAGTVESADARIERLENTAAALQAQPGDTIKLDTSRFTFAAADADKPVLLLGTYRADGQIEIHDVMRHDNSAVAVVHGMWGSSHKAAVAAVKQAPKQITAVEAAMSGN